MTKKVIVSQAEPKPITAKQVKAFCTWMMRNPYGILTKGMSEVKLHFERKCLQELKSGTSEYGAIKQYFYRQKRNKAQGREIREYKAQKTVTPKTTGRPRGRPPRPHAVAKFQITTAGVDLSQPIKTTDFAIKIGQPGNKRQKDFPGTFVINTSQDRHMHPYLLKIQQLQGDLAAVKEREVRLSEEMAAQRDTILEQSKRLELQDAQLDKQKQEVTALENIRRHLAEQFSKMTRSINTLHASYFDVSSGRAVSRFRARLLQAVWRDRVKKYVARLGRTRGAATIRSHQHYLYDWAEWVDKCSNGISDGLVFKQWCERRDFARRTCHMLANMVRRFHEQYDDSPMRPVIPVGAKRPEGARTCPEQVLKRLMGKLRKRIDTAAAARRPNQDLLTKLLGKYP